LLIGGCVVAVIALILGLIFLVMAMTRRKRRQPIAAARYVASAPAQYTPQAPPAMPYQPNPQAYAQPQPPMASGARICPNGHMVVESDATFCPNCGALLTS
jgi:hypothetical protein